MTITLHGIWSPMPTPFSPSGEVDVGRLNELTDYLIEGGVDGLFPLGTTGEFALLDREERKRVVEVVAERAHSRVPVLAGICDPSPRNAITFAKDAADAGADGVVATPPYYYRLGEEGLYTHFKMIHESVSLPLVLYNIPEWTHNFVPVSVVSRLAEERAIVGMKYTEYNFFNLLSFIRAVGDRISVLTGSDAMTYSCLEAGGSGAVISVSNIFPKEASSIFDLVEDGKLGEAQKVQEAILPAIEAAGVGYFPAGLKEAMRAVGFPVGGVRKPQTPLSREESDRVRDLLKKTGLKYRPPEED
ncbi:MAG: dihydrodipicolinate synthase family protein [Nitrososphaerota archaeon]|nr:dihydrodipicolinate synthase family protein [Nitrososphaerota archaeon]MDG7024110.1 dihydrodipicolinate synthase family protein [Nitrososphaerota archaeon]